MVKKILVTGGPVHANLDSVKIITNRFTGARMFALAKSLKVGFAPGQVLVSVKGGEIIEGGAPP